MGRKKNGKSEATKRRTAAISNIQPIEGETSSLVNFALTVGRKTKQTLITIQKAFPKQRTAKYTRNHFKTFGGDWTLAFESVMAW